MTNLPLVVLWGLKVTPLLLGAWLLTAVLRRASAATRHLIWMVALGAALGLPAAGMIAPRWEVRVLPPTPAPSVQPAGPIEPAAQAFAVLDPTPPPVREAAGSAVAGETRRAAPAVSPTTVWAMGVLLMSVLLALSLARTAHLTREARVIDDGPVTDEVRTVACQLGVRRNVRVRIAGRDAMPMTWGAFHPTIVLPAGFADWPAARRRTVLLHELAHVQRWDWMTQLVAQLTCLVYWWHPLAWVAARRLREERELACDDIVLAHGTTPSAYASDLLEIARAHRARPALAAVAMARRSQLADRLLAVLDGARARGRVARRQAVPAVGVGLAAVLPLAGLAAGHAVRDADLLANPITAVGSPLRDDGASSLPAGASTLAPVQVRATTLCDWSTRGSKNSSSSTNIDDDRMTIQVARDDCTLSVRAQGKITFADTDRDVERLGRGGYFEIEERMGRARRRVEVSETDGSLRRRWYVDGTEQAYGDEARAWLGDVILVLFRRTGLNAEARATRILEQGGSDALIAEIAQMQSDWAASRYYVVLFEGAQLTPQQQTTLVQDAGRRIVSDHALGEVLRALANRGPLDPSVQRAYIAAAGSIESDHEQGQVLAALALKSDLGVEALDAMLASADQIESSYQRATLLLAIAERYPATRPLPASYLNAVTGMDSDHERGRVLGRLLERDRLSAADRVRVLDAVAQIGSDHQQAELLLALLQAGPIESAIREPFFRAVSGIGSSFERQRVLIAAAGGPGPGRGEPVPDEATLLAVVEAARGISSGHSKAEVLLAVAARGLSTDALRRAYLETADGISSRSDRERVMQAAGVSRI